MSHKGHCIRVDGMLLAKVAPHELADRAGAGARPYNRIGEWRSFGVARGAGGCVHLFGVKRLRVPSRLWACSGDVRLTV